jgi:hypothetical protein
MHRISQSSESTAGTVHFFDNHRDIQHTHYMPTQYKSLSSDDDTRPGAVDDGGKVYRHLLVM